MQKPFRYRIVTEWSDDDGVFVARVPALGPGCVAHGKTEGEATKEAKTAATLMLDVLREDRKALPPEDASPDYSGQLRLRLPKTLHERISQMATAEGVSLNTMLLTLIADGHGWRSAGGGAPSENKPKAKRKTAA